MDGKKIGVPVDLTHPQLTLSASCPDGEPCDQILHTAYPEITTASVLPPCYHRYPAPPCLTFKGDLSLGGEEISSLPSSKIVSITGRGCSPALNLKPPTPRQSVVADCCHFKHIARISAKLNQNKDARRISAEQELQGRRLLVNTANNTHMSGPETFEVSTPTCHLQELGAAADPPLHLLNIFSPLSSILHWRETEEWRRREKITKRKMETKGVVLIVHRLWFQPREFLINPVTSDCGGQISLKHEEFLVRVRPHAPLPSRADKYLLVLFQCLYMLSRLRWSCPPCKV